MPIVDIQRRFRELGRIRTGQVVETGKLYKSGSKKGQPVTRPTKLPRFRLTSPWEHLIQQAAEVFGGTPAPWHNDGTGGDEFEVVVEVDSLPVVIPPGEVFEQWYELWTGGGCSKRCDGVRQVLVDRPCSCPEDPIVRQEKAAKGEACKPTTRVRLMLPDVADVGIWRLESHGFHAAAELGGAAGLVEAATRQGAMIPADLRLQAREGARRPGQPKKSFYVPAITFRGTLGPVLAALGILEEGATMPRLLGVEPRPAIDSGGQPALPPAGTPFDPAPVEPASLPGPPPEPPAAPAPPPPDPGPADALSEAFPGAGFEPPEADDQGELAPEPEVLEPPAHEPDEQVPSEEGGGALSGPAMIAIRAKTRGYEDRDERLALVSAIVGRLVKSTKELRVREVSVVLGVLDDEEKTESFSGAALGYFEQIVAEQEAAKKTAEPAAAETKEPDPPAPEPDAPAAPAPLETTGREAAPRVPRSPAPDDPSTWDAAKWREVLKDRGVKVSALLKEASRLARAAGSSAPGTLDDVGSSGLAAELLGFVETQASDR